MITAPYDLRALSALPQTLATTCTVSATTANGEHLADLDVSSLVLALDEAWSPQARGSLTFTCPDPTILDPRRGVRAAIRLGYRYPGGELDEHLAASLAFTEWSARAPGGDVHGEVYGDELALQEWVPLGWTRTYAMGTPIVRVIADLLAGTLGRYARETAASSATLDEPLVVGPGVRVWDVIKSLSDQADLWTYADPLGVWHIVNRPQSLGASVVQVTTGPVGIATEIETGLSRTDWGNAVELEYADGHYAYAHEEQGPMGTAAVGVSAVQVRTSAPWPGSAAAQRAARALLTRTFTRGQSQALTALAAWWVRPGDTITNPDGRRAIVSRVQFTYPDSLMTITTREAD